MNEREIERQLRDYRGCVALINSPIPIRWIRIRANHYRSFCGRFEIDNWGPGDVFGEGNWLLTTRDRETAHHTLQDAKDAAERKSSCQP